MGNTKQFIDEWHKNKAQKSETQKFIDRWYRYNNADSSMVDQAYMQSFAKDYENYIKTATADYDKMNWGNASASYDARNNAWTDLSNRANAIGAYFYKNRDTIDENVYNTFNDYLDQIYDSGQGIADSYKSAYDLFSQFDSQEDYDVWKKEQEYIDSLKQSADYSNMVASGKANKNMTTWDLGALIYLGAYGNQIITEMGKDFDYMSKYLNDNEMSLLYYYLGKGDLAGAEKAYRSNIDLANQRKAGKMSARYDSTVLEPFVSLGAGVSSFFSGFDNATNALANLAMLGTYTIPTNISTPYQYAFGEMSENNQGLWKATNDLAQTIGNQLPAMALNAMSGGVLGSLPMGISAAGNAYSDFKALGYGEAQSVAYGITIGVLESKLQELMGGISGLGSEGGIVQGVVKKVLPQITNGLARASVKLGANMLDEGLEEFAQGVLEPIVQQLVSLGMTPNGEKRALEIDWGETVYSGLLGALSAGVLEGGTDTINTLQLNSQYNKAYSNNPQALKALLESIAMENPDLDISKVQNRVDAGKNVSGNMIRELAYQNELANWNKDYNKVVSATESRLNELGEQGNVKKLAESIARAQFGDFGSAIENAENIVRGTKDANADTLAYAMADYRGDVKNLSRSDKRNIRESEYGSRVSNELNPDMRAETSSAWAEDIKTYRLGKGAEGVAKTQATLKALKDSTKAPTVAPNVFNYKSGAIIPTLTKEGVQAKEKDLEGIANNRGYKGATHEAFVKGYKGENLEEYQLGFDEAYRMGRTMVRSEELQKAVFKSYINEEAQMSAYNSGYTEAKYEAIKKAEGRVKTEKVKGGFTVTVPLSNEALTKSRQTAIEFFKVVAEVANANIKVVEDAKNHGLYDPKTNTISIDVNLGGKDFMVFSLSHELTHRIREMLPEEFDDFAKMLFEAVGGKMSITERIKLWEKNNKQYYPKLTPAQLTDLAYEEVVCEMCESFLTDEVVARKFSEKVQKENKTLWEKIKDFFTELINRLKEAYKGLDPQSENGRLVREMTNDLTKVKEAWVELVVESGKADVEAATELGIEIDTKSESVSPTLASRKTWEESDYVLNRDIMAEKIASALNVSERKAKKYIDDINSIARIISDDRARLDYQASSFGSAFVSNVEYGGSFDYTTLCKKRRIYTGTFSEIQKRLHDVALTPDDILTIRNLMIEQGIEATCGLCYVEGSRANMGKFAQKFIELYKRDNPNAWIPTMADVNTPDGVEQMRINHPEVYESYEYFWNHYGKLKESDPALFASQQKPKLYEARKEYKGEILTHFKGETAIGKKNLNGGIRMQSFSDFEIVHLIDTMQVIMDMSTVGLAGQAYTKVPEFALAFGDTGLKINLSLIAKGVDGNGKLIFDDREGMPHETAFDIRNKYSKNVGTIIVTFTDEQLMAAMADDRIDFIIPFHRSQWKKGQYGAMGLPKGTKDYTFMQNEKLIKQNYHEYRGRMVKDKATNYMPNEYWDFSKSGKENAEKYLQMCAENNKRPKFYKLLDYDGNGTYSLKKDGSTDGYWKLLIDFKMYDNDGKGSPQTPVIPRFNMEESTKMLDEYKGGHEKYPIAYDVVDKFVEQYNDENKTKYSHKNIVDIYTEKQYNDFGWVRWNNVISAGRWKNFTENFAQAVTGLQIFPKSNLDEFMIEVYDAYDPMSDYDTIVFAKGTIESPIITRIIKFNSTNHTLLEETRGDIYALEKRGIRQKIGRIFNSYSSTDFPWSANGRGNNNENARYNNRLGAKRRRSEIVANPIVRIRVDEETNTITTTYRNGQIITSVLGEQDYKHSRKTVDPFTSREALAKALSKVAKGDEKVLLEQYKSNLRMIEGEVNNLKNLRKKIDAIKYKKSITYKGENLSVKEFEQRAYTQAEAMGVNAENVKFKAHKDTGKYVATVDGKVILEADKAFRSKEEADHINTLEHNYQATLVRISKYDASLLKIEAMQPMKQLLSREKAKAYKEAEAKGKEALKEYKAQALEEQKAITQRYQEMRHKNVEGRKTTEMRHKLMNTVHTLDQLLVNPTKKKHIPIGLQKPVAEALNILNMDTVGAEERLAKITAELKVTDDPYEMEMLLERYNRIKAQGDKIKEKIDSLKSAYAEILNSEDDIIRNSYDEVIANTIEQVASKVGDTPVRDMSYDQLESLYKMYRMILKTIRDANKSFAMAKGEEITTLGQNVMSEVAYYERKDKTVLPLLEKGIKFDWNNLKPVYAFERIGSSTLSELYNNVRHGEDVWAVDMRDAKTYSDAQKAKYGFKSWNMDKTYTFHTPLGKEFKLNLGQIMSIYAYTRRGEQAIEHLINGGFVYDGVTVVEKKIGGKIKVDAELTDSTAYRLDEAVIGQINATLTKEQREFAEVMQKYLSETMGEKGNEVSLALYDIKIFGEKNYFPLKSSQVFLERAREQARGEVKIKNKGFTKETTPRANNPITLTSFMDVWADHCIEMSMYHAFTLPLEDFYRVYNYKERATDEKDTESVIMNLENAYGKSVTSYIDQLLVDLNGGLRTDPRAGALGGLIAGFKKASTMASLSVVVQQPSSIIRAMSMVDAKYFVDKPSKYTHKETWEEVKKYAPVAVIKEMGYFDVGLGKTSQEWLKNEPTKYEQFEEKWLTRAPALADEMGWNILWKAVKRETVAKHPELKFNSEEFLNECGRRFTEVVELTQVYDSVFSRSANMRSKDTGMKMVTSFMAEPTTIANMLENAILQAKRGNKKILGKTIGAIVFSSLVNAIAVSFVYAARDDDDEEYWNKYLKKFVDNFGSNLNPLNLYPFARDFMSLIEGFDIERADMNLLSALVKAVRRLASNKVDAVDKVADLAGAIANLFGIPLKNIYRDFVEPIWRRFTK